MTPTSKDLNDPMKPSPKPKNESASLAPRDSSAISPPEKPSVNLFLELLEQGINSWEKAGRILVQLYSADSLVFDKIVTRCDWLTKDVLWSFYRVGQGKIYPRMLLLGNRPGERRLLYCTPEIQKKLCSSPVEVVTHLERGQPVIVKKTISELTRKEVYRVFVSDHTRTVKEQVALIAPRPPAKPIKIEFRPCPFCGSSMINFSTNTAEHSIICVCQHCGASGPTAGNQTDAKRYWNERI